METDKLISIILPVYNGEKHLAKSIESCLSQSYKNIELIIVNDCSTDATLEIITDFASKDDRIKIINNDINKKLPASLNIGHKVANGDLFTWTSHDNIYEPSAIEELAKPILLGHADVTYANLFLIDSEGNFKKETILPEIENLIFGNCVGASFLYRKEVFERNNGYNEHLFLVEDYDFWIRAFNHSKFIHINNSFYNYRTHEESLTYGINENPEKNKLWKNNLLKMYEVFFSAYLKEFSNTAIIFTQMLTEYKLDFDLLIKENQNISLLKKKLSNNKNIESSKNVERIFLKKYIEMISNTLDEKNTISKSLYLLKNYYKVMDKNDFKTLIKFIFFK
ncbi:glycosyltransferase [Flavobacterium sp. H122]|uniref:glycosyltransferase family 2 protein n=1 Tax=Flavobacterium sp. H122 TaxID=2529860 RepID=UPI0010AA9C6A|nr:glycosyltransferase [Flavobacterium sp. H122]